MAQRGVVPDLLTDLTARRIFWTVIIRGHQHRAAASCACESSGVHETARDSAARHVAGLLDLLS